MELSSRTARKKNRAEGERILLLEGAVVSEDGKILSLEVKKGDKILFGKYSGTEIKINGEEYLIMREDDVLGIVH